MKTLNAATDSVPARPRKRRARREPNPSRQYHTAVEAYRDPEVNRTFRGMRAQILSVMRTAHDSLTAAEVRAKLGEMFDRDVPESTIHAQLHALFRVKVVTDHDTVDRDCTVSRRFKKTWRAVSTGEWHPLDDVADPVA